MRYPRFTAIAVLLLIHSCLFISSGSAADGAWLDGTAILQGQKALGGIRAEAVPHQPFAARQMAAGRAEAAPQLGQIDTFWIVDFTTYTLIGILNLNEDKVQLDAELVRISPHAYLYVESGFYVEPGILDELVAEFEGSIYNNVASVFGPPPDALDGDPHVTILVSTFPGTSLFGATVAGYFDDANQYTDSEARYMQLGHSNEREMMYVNREFLVSDPFTGQLDPLVLGIFAHEYQHLVQWGDDRDEVVWLNEGLSEYSMYLCGFDDSAQQHMEGFSVAPTVSLTEWGNSLESYGCVYYFFRYLAEHYGGSAAIAAISDDPLNGVESVDRYLRENFGVRFAKVFRDWTMANLLDTDSGDYSYALEMSPVWWRNLYESVGIHEFQPVFFTERYDTFGIPLFSTYLFVRSGEYYLFHRAPGELNAAMYGAVSVDGTWDMQVTYVGLNQVGVGPAWTYTVRNESAVQLNSSGNGQFQIPTGDNHFALVIRNASATSDSLGGNPDMTYSIQTFPGFASNIVNDLTPPASVADLAVESVKGDRVTMTWTAPGDDGVLGRASVYDMRYNTSPVFLTQNFNISARVPEVVDPGLPGTAERKICADLPQSSVLYFMLRTADDAGNVSWSNMVSATTGLKDLVAPAQITSLQALGQGTGELVVGWTATGDDGTVGQAAAYDLRASRSPITDELSFRRAEIVAPPEPGPAGTSEQATVTGLGPESHMVYVAVRAIDEVGNVGPISNVLSYLYQDQPPDTVIAHSPAAFSIETDAGVNPPTQALTVWNGGGGTLSYTIETAPSWLSASPGFGSSDGAWDQNAHDVTIQSSSLWPGNYAGTITINDPGAVNHPVVVPVDLTVRVSPIAVTVTQPAAGANVPAGLATTLGFTCTNLPAPGDAHLYAVRNGVYYYLGLVPWQNGANSVQVKLPGNLPTGTDYRFLMFWTQNLSVKVWSSSFNVTPPPVITVTQPASGTIWQAGTVENLAFSCTNLPAPGSVYVYAVRQGVYYYLGTKSCQNGANVVPVQLPGYMPPASDYQVLIFWAENLSVKAWSDPFTVSIGATITVTAPSAGTVWNAGASGDLAFTCASFPGPGNMHAYLLRGSTYVGYLGLLPFDNGANVVPITLSRSLRSGTDYSIQLFWADNLAVNARSANFSVSGIPSFQITWPTAGANWGAGTPGNLAFTGDNLLVPGQAHVYAWRDGAYYYLGLVPCQNGPNVVPIVLSASLPVNSGYRILMFWAENLSVSAWSETFNVTTMPSFQITWPNAGALWPAGTSLHLTFLGSNIPPGSSVRAYVVRNGAYRDIGQYPCTNGYNDPLILMPSDLTPASDYRIRLFYTDNAAIYAWSAQFSVL